MIYLPHRKLFLGLLIAADALLLVLGCFIWLIFTLPQLPENPDSLLSQSGINIYAQSGELLYTFNQSVEQVEIADVSPHFLQAVLATEDLSFYRHRGYSLKGIAGAILDKESSVQNTTFIEDYMLAFQQ